MIVSLYVLISYTNLPRSNCWEIPGISQIGGISLQGRRERPLRRRIGIDSIAFGHRSGAWTSVCDLDLVEYTDFS